MTYSITEARYAKGKLIVRSSDDSGYKTPEARLIEALGGRYAGRDAGYISSPRQVADFETLLAAGWRGHPGIYRGDRPYFTHPDYVGLFSRQGAMIMATDRGDKP